MGELALAGTGGFLVRLCYPCLHGDDDFSSGVSCFKIPDRFSSLTQRVTSVDDGYDFARFKKLFHEKPNLFCYGFASPWKPIFLPPAFDIQGPRIMCSNKRGKVVNPAMTQIPWGFKARCNPKPNDFPPHHKSGHTAAHFG